jgi:hypothetical protein
MLEKKKQHLLQFQGRALFREMFSAVYRMNGICQSPMIESMDQCEPRRAHLSLLQTVSGLRSCMGDVFYWQEHCRPITSTITSVRKRDSAGLDRCACRPTDKLGLPVGHLISDWCCPVDFWEFIGPRLYAGLVQLSNAPVLLLRPTTC